MNMCFGFSFVETQFCSFLDLQIKYYGEMKFLEEVWIGWANAGTNQQELTTCAQKCGQDEEGEFWQGRKTGTCS
jgi:hypothetical protein